MTTEDPTKIQVDEQVVEQLTEVADTLGQLLERVVDRHEGHVRDLDYLRDDLKTVREAIRHIAKVLHEGNGDKPLISRVAVLEEKVHNLEEDDKEREERLKIERKGKYALYTALATGVLGLATAIIGLLAG